ncbi:MAG: hypothetical protein P8188_04440 [Gemmatimonadota bacterium]|jgi:hypothetical protein
MPLRTAGRPAFLLLASLALGLAVFSPSALSAQTADELSVQATDPTAPLFQLNLIGDVTPGFNGSDESGFAVRFQPVIPFQAWGWDNIMRVVVPYQMSGPGAEGLKDVAIFDLVLVAEEWGRWGVGPVMNIAEGVSDRDAQFSFGPAIGAVYGLNPDLNLGIFNQNLFGDDVAISQFQPVVAYQLGNGWALTGGDLQFIFDWHDGSWIQAPLGFQLGVVRPILGQPMRFYVNPMWNLVDREGSFDSKILIGMTLIAPTGG